jgi:hypothetical protein
MSVLIIDEEEKAAIAEAMRKAREHPIPLNVLMDVAVADETDTLDSTTPKRMEFLRKYTSQQIMLGTYRAAFSYEYQPAGLFKHLSVSSHKKGKVPGVEVMKMIMEEFGFSGIPLKKMGRMWTEEFEPEWHAVNVVEITEEVKMPEFKNEMYLGDGLYASFDGFTFWLRAPRDEGDHFVALEPMVLQAFINYVEACAEAKNRVKKD